MKKLFLKSLVLLFPFLVFTSYFFIADPMKIIHNITDPTSKGVLMNDRLFLARYLENTNTQYNAFIFGSSRSKAFKTYHWKQFLNQNSKPFHMGVNDETLYGLERKLNFLDSMGFKISHALITLDHRLLSLTKDHEAHIFREYPSMTEETSASFYQRFYIAFLNPSFLKSYFSYLKTGHIKSESNFLWDPGFTYHHKTGDIDYTRMENAIKKDSILFYKTNRKDFYERTPHESEQLIGKDSKVIWEKIHKILKKHHTEVKIIITPNYDQITINPDDLKYLKTMFSNKVSNYSGKNGITDEIGNYYEHKHFKPFIANGILTLSYVSFRKVSE